MGDSGLMVRLPEEEAGDPLDAKLTAEQRAIGHLVRRTCRREPLLAGALRALGRRRELAAHRRAAPAAHAADHRRDDHERDPQGQIRNAWGQGVARHTRENIDAIGVADVDALATLIGDKPYLFGDAPTSYDATAYGFLANGLAFPADGAVAKHARGEGERSAYVERIKGKYWAAAEVKAA